MPWWIPRPSWAIFLGGLAAGACLAQASPSLREATDAAWALSPQARALASRQAELDARADAAASFFAGAPSVSASYRSDRIGSDTGLRESELELSAPLWTPALRGATARQVQAERADVALQQATARARLAAEVREAAAEATLAQIEHELARGRVREAQALAGDIERRVRAGESARVDLLQAQSVLRQAQGAEALAAGGVARAAAQWRALTGLPQLPTLDEGIGAAQEAPAVVAARARRHAAEARLAVARAEQRDPVEVGVGMVRERPVAGAPTGLP
jgi:cobalt-zinc-cadmium efflux system outer membrane protein